MEEEGFRKWEVTYTKHVKQKRKVYHDGFLTFHHRDSNKVMLYDEFMKLLDSKLLKNDEDVVAGGSILFPGFLVDVSSYISHPQTTASYNSPPPPPRNKNNKLSPSQKIIRDFKRNQVGNYPPPPPSPAPAPSSSKEWEALYTTQITQKAKKYHDGFLRLIYSGTLSRQEDRLLYDYQEWKRPRFGHLPPPPEPPMLLSLPSSLSKALPPFHIKQLNNDNHNSRCLLTSFRQRQRRRHWKIRFALDSGGQRVNNDDDVNGLGQTRLSRILIAGGTQLLAKLNSARNNFPTKVFLLLLGFYTANALATILGQTGDWDVLVAGIVVAAIEGIGMLMYKKPRSSSSSNSSDLIVFINYWKAGVCLGLFVDAFKLGS